MKIVLYSPNFHPLTGGLENVVMDLALEFAGMGHAAVVLTRTPGRERDIFPFQVERQANLLREISIMRTADVVLQFNVSLKGLLPWLFSGRPLAISLQTAHWPDWRGRLKTWVANHLSALNIGCSRYMSGLVERAVTIPNPYDAGLFTTKIPWHERTGGIIFVGRLVSDKGADLVLHALAALKREALTPRLTIVGDGPERQPLTALADALGLAPQVTFAGLQKGPALVALLNRHRVMVIPSVWLEPFGIVALEGLACGCLVVGSAGGGLSEAIGGLGLTFPNSDIPALTHCLRQALVQPGHYLPHPDAVALHLQRHRREQVAMAYIQALQEHVIPFQTNHDRSATHV